MATTTIRATTLRYYQRLQGDLELQDLKRLFGVIYQIHTFRPLHSKSLVCPVVVVLGTIYRGIRGALTPCLAP